MDILCPQSVSCQQCLLVLESFHLCAIRILEPCAHGKHPLCPQALKVINGCIGFHASTCSACWHPVQLLLQLNGDDIFTAICFCNAYLHSFCLPKSHMHSSQTPRNCNTSPIGICMYRARLPTNCYMRQWLARVV